jgi:HEAT repeat protein/TolA-binding protein
MKPTLLRLIAITATMPMLAAAQIPPTPPEPSPQRPPASPRPPKPSEMPSPPVLLSPKFELEYRLDLMGPKLEEVRLRAEEMRLHAMELANIDVEHVKRQAEEMRHFAMFDAEHMKWQAEEMRQLAKFDVERIKMGAEELKQMSLLGFPGKMTDAFTRGTSKSDKPLDARPRAPWASEDPADSIYRLAREALNRGEYRRAAQLFNEVTKKYPRSEYAIHSAYYEAFARYRAGGTDDLREALKILEERSTQFASIRNDGNVDGPALQARIQGALAARGDEKAAEAVRKNAAQSGGCDREEVGVRAEALSALGQMDLAAAMPVIKKVLGRLDECTIELRRRALYVIGRQPTNEAVAIILDVAKNDPDPGIRGEAMRWLPRVAGDNAVPQLEDILRSSTDEQTQRSAIHALGSIDTERARRAVRTIIERNDAAERVRYDAIISLSRDREGRTLSADEMNYVRSLYAKLESARLKEAVLTSASRVPTPENQQFLLGIVRNTNETPSLRVTALQRLGRMETVTAVEIAKLYDVADTRSLREQILSALSQRKEPEAIDKMIEIARKDTDPQIRRYAISLLTRSNNARAKQFLQEMIDKW